MGSLATTIQTRNVNNAFEDAWWRLRVDGIQEDSRNGPVLVLPGPVITTYERPCERVLFHPKRDCNHVFHLVEAIWMLAGRDNVDDLLPFNSKYRQFAEEDGRVHGAYGMRWRGWFNVDQIYRIINMLKENPNSRQCVMQMWDCEADLVHKTLKDRPCNTHIYFDARGGSLNMTVLCRSNDMLWGAYGANVVHFSMLQEVIARGVGIHVGVYHQVSNNFHVYTDLPIVDEFIKNPPYGNCDMYAHQGVVPTPLFVGDETANDFLNDCEDFFRLGVPSAFPRTWFFKETALPLARAYINRRHGDRIRMDPESRRDWFVAFNEWFDRRKDEQGQ